MFERTKNNVKNTCTSLCNGAKRSIHLLKKLYALELTMLLIVAGTISITIALYAAPNQAFVYQGRLVDANYTPVTNGTYYMKLKIYSDASGGNANCRWATGSVTNASLGTITNNCTESLSTSVIQVSVSHGSFAIHLGDISLTGGKMPDISNLAFKTTTYYLGVTVCGSGTDAATACSGNPAPAEMTPLLAITGSTAAASNTVTLQSNMSNQVPGTYTTITGTEINNTDAAITSFTVGSTAGYPSSGTLLIDNEVMTYTGTTTAPNPETFTGVTRARHGTTAAAHSGSTVKTYLFSGAANATTRPVFFVTSDGGAFVNANTSPFMPSQVALQINNATSYAFGNDQLGNNYFNIRAGNLDDFSIPTFYRIRPETSVSGLYSAHQFYGRNTALTSANSTNYATLSVSPPIISLTGSTQVTTQMDSILFNRAKIASIAAGVADAATFTIAGPPILTAGVMTNAYALKINSANANGGAAPTNAYGLAVAATTGATNNNYSAIITGGNVGIGTAAPIAQLHVPGRVPTALLSSTSTGSNTTPIGVVVQGRYAYLINYATDALRIYDVSDPAAPVAVNGAGTTTGDGPQAIYAQGHYVYIINTGSPRSLQIFDVSNPAAPTSIGTAPLTAVSYSINVKGRYVYIATTSTGTSNTNSLQIFDAGNPKNPLLISTTAVGTDPFGIDVQGRYAYISNSATSNFYIVDISSPTTPTIVATSNTIGFGQHKVVVQGRYAYFTTSQNRTLSIIDVSNPSAPAWVGSVGTGDIVEGLAVQGRYAYVTRDYASGSPQFQIYNISNPASPTLVGSLAMDGGAQSVFVQGRYAYTVTVITNNLEIFDLGGGYIQQLETGGLEIANGSVRSNFTVNNNLDVRGGATIGIGGMYSAGPMTVNGLELASIGSMFEVRNSAGTPLFKIANDGFVMLGFELTSGNSLSFANGAARTIGIESGLIAGQDLTFKSGSSGSGTNLIGGALTIESGNSAGNALSRVIIQVPQNNTTSDIDVRTAASMFEFVNGHIASIALGSAPSISGCGTGSNIAAGSNDIAGQITVGSGLASGGCTLTFARAYTTTPLCQMLYQGGITNMTAYIGAASASAISFKFTPTPSSGGASKTEPGNTATSINSISGIVTPGTYALDLTITGGSPPYNFQYRWGGVSSQPFSGYPSNTQVTINGGNQGTLTFTTANTPPSFGSVPTTLTDQVTVSTSSSFSYFCIGQGSQ